MAARELSAAQARRVALAALGFGKPRPASPDRRHVRRVIDTLGLLQLDFVNVLVPAQQLVLFSRVGAYDRDRLRDVVYGSGHYTEQWAHEASIVPMDAWPLLEHRRKNYRPWPNNPILKLPCKGRDYLADVVAIVRERGAVCSSDLPAVDGPKRRPGDWHRSVPRWALEYHFGCGNLAVADRLPNFQRIYDLPERVIPAKHLERRLADADARRELLRHAARSLGIATAHDLADYYRMSARDAMPHIPDLVAAGEITEVRVEGWREAGYLHRDARVPRQIEARALLSPFDPVAWYRPRTERLFDFHYRIEIYVPAAQRRWGYYVLPFLLGDRLVARVDLKADRKRSRLLVQAAHAEPDIDRGATCDALALELRELGAWLDLERVVVGRRGDLAQELRNAVSGLRTDR